MRILRMIRHCAAQILDTSSLLSGALMWSDLVQFCSPLFAPNKNHFFLSGKKNWIYHQIASLEL